MIIDCGRLDEVVVVVALALSLSRPFVNACSAMDCALAPADWLSSMTGLLTVGGEVPIDPVIGLGVGTLNPA